MNKIQVLKNMIVRAPRQHLDRLHPNAKKIRNRMSQTPEPLTFKLKDMPTGVQAPEEVITPLGPLPDLPFHVARSHVGNLPVYRKYTHGAGMKRTVIRHISGDVDAFKKELSKVVSNAEIVEKIGRVEVKGMHKESVMHWLTRLGF